MPVKRLSSLARNVHQRMEKSISFIDILYGLVRVRKEHLPALPMVHRVGALVAVAIVLAPILMENAVVK